VTQDKEAFTLLDTGQFAAVLVGGGACAQPSRRGQPMVRLRRAVNRIASCLNWRPHWSTTAPRRRNCA
jgi:hypothetical protein